MLMSSDKEGEEIPIQAQKPSKDIAQKVIGLSHHEKKLQQEMPVFTVMMMLRPFAPGRLENLASKAAITAAKELGFDGEFDIADHIESNKSGCYSKPLVDHIAHHISLFLTEIRKAVKLLLLNVELGAIKGNVKGISEILTGSNYLYEKTEKMHGNIAWAISMSN
ncbi:hypothetical protein DXG03_005647 [Asterophora parasitica]|uniref:Uncharacterized protein n=1 Tax=Asterophora parasitica TaxID=117018 RepID=A0A9P7K8L7_9AGAR|nr:hypothetical protein DXG03_005647 [Asterophora parasitica]